MVVAMIQFSVCFDNVKITAAPATKLICHVGEQVRRCPDDIISKEL